MLRTRVISAAVLLAIIAVPFFLGGWPFLLLIVVAGALGAWEYTSLFRQGGAQPLTWLCILLTVLFILEAAMARHRAVFRCVDTGGDRLADRRPLA